MGGSQNLTPDNELESVDSPSDSDRSDDRSNVSTPTGQTPTPEPVPDAHDNERESVDSSSDTDGTYDSLEYDKDDDDYFPAVEVAQNQENEPRRSQRDPKPKRMNDYMTYLCAAKTHDPLTVSEAMSRPDAEKWKQAMAKEISSFEENCAWELVPPENVSFG